MTYAVYTTESFEKEIEKISAFERGIIQKMFLQLKENPYIGGQIRYRFFREKKIKDKRIYYLIYDDLKAVLVVAFGGKKAQQETIDETVKYFPEFRRYLENLLKSERR
ncbi:hypothetical protein J4433_03460 [Candidatus Pacearchaeota archaeon]|nr:hypothetical protein [Candidatus Pacearchaeota archaeon]